MHVKEVVKVYEGSVTFAFVYRQNRIEAIALEIKSLGHSVSNIGLDLLGDGWYALPIFNHVDWVQFNRIINEAQKEINFLAVKESLMAAHYAHFELAVQEEEVWIGTQRQRTDQARVDMKRAVETGSVEAFFAVIENFFKRFRK